jgi:hypothetical protein
MDKTKLNSLDGLEILVSAENYLFSKTYAGPNLGNPNDKQFWATVELLRQTQSKVIKQICGIIGQHFQETTGNYLAAQQIMSIALQDEAIRR